MENLMKKYRTTLKQRSFQSISPEGLLATGVNRFQFILGCRVGNSTFMETPLSHIICIVIKDRLCAGMVRLFEGRTHFVIVLACPSRDNGKFFALSSGDFAAVTALIHFLVIHCHAVDD